MKLRLCGSFSRENETCLLTRRSSLSKKVKGSSYVGRYWTGCTSDCFPSCVWYDAFLISLQNSIWSTEPGDLQPEKPQYRHQIVRSHIVVEANSRNVIWTGNAVSINFHAPPHNVKHFSAGMVLTIKAEGSENFRARLWVVSQHFVERRHFD